MKKIKYIIALCSFLSVGLASCVGEGDFDTDRISLRDLHPTFLLPLLQDTLSLHGQPNISHDGDTSEILYNVEHIQLPAREHWFSVPDVDASLPVQYSAGSAVPDADVTLPSLSFPLSLDGGQELDSLFCSGLPVKITFTGLPSLELVEVTFPQILVNGRPYTDTVDVTSTTDFVLPACKIIPKDKKDLEVLIRLKGTIPASVNAHMRIQIQDIGRHYTALFGYFGQETVTVKDSIELNIMDDLNITAASLEFDILKVTASIQNSMGIPFRLTLDKIQAYDRNGRPLPVQTPGKDIDILAPGYTDPIAITNKTVRCENFGQILNKDTRKIVFSFTCKSNPNGSGRNFLTPANILEPAVSVKIPLFVKAQGLVLQDTVGLNMSSVSLEGLKLQMRLKNSLPIAATLNVRLLDENNTPYATPLINDLKIEQPTRNNGIAVDSTELQQSISISKDLFGQLKKSTHALATIAIDTGTDYVKFMKDNSLYMKIGAEVKFTYEELLD
jgi:hypothetical protein